MFHHVLHGYIIFSMYHNYHCLKLRIRSFLYRITYLTNNNKQKTVGKKIILFSEVKNYTTLKISHAVYQTGNCHCATLTLYWQIWGQFVYISASGQQVGKYDGYMVIRTRTWSSWGWWTRTRTGSLWGWWTRTRFKITTSNNLTKYNKFWGI